MLLHVLFGEGKGNREKGKGDTADAAANPVPLRNPPSSKQAAFCTHRSSAPKGSLSEGSVREKGKGDTADAAAISFPLRNPPSSKRAAFCTHRSSAPKGSLSEGAVSRSLTEGVLPVQLNPCVKSMICPGPLFPAACCLLPVPSSPRSPVPRCLLPVPSSPRSPFSLFPVPFSLKPHASTAPRIYRLCVRPWMKAVNMAMATAQQTVSAMGVAQTMP